MAVTPSQRQYISYKIRIENVHIQDQSLILQQVFVIYEIISEGKRYILFNNITNKITKCKSIKVGTLQFLLGSQFIHLEKKINIIKKRKKLY